MGRVKKPIKIFLIILMINIILICSNIYMVKAEEGQEPVIEGEENNNENPEGENSPEGIDLSGIEGADGLLGGLTGEAVQEGPKNVIERVDITAHLNKDGSANMTEVWNVNMVTGTELTRIYTDFSSYKASNLSVLDKTTGRQYTFVDNWNDITEKADRDDKCAIVDLGNLVNICWGIGEYGRHEYIVRYTISDFVKDYTSYQLVYLKVLQDNMDPAPRKS